MKTKIKVLIFSLFVLFIMTGCGTNKNKILTCSGINPGTNMNADSKIKYTFENKKLTKANIEVIFKDITVDNLSSMWDNIKTQFTEQNKPVTELGYKREVKADDNNYTFSVIIEIDYNNISKEIMKKYGVEDYRSKTYEELKTTTTTGGIFSCK